MKLIILNGIEVLIEESEKYIQINDIQEKDLPVVWETLRKNFPGYELVLCFRDMAVSEDALASIGAEVLEDCLTMKTIPDGFMPYKCDEVAPLEKADFAAFAALHDRYNPDCGGTSRHIWEKWGDWPVFLLRQDGEIIGYALILINLRDAAMGEIFCVWARNLENRKALVSAATMCAFINGKNEVIYMVDRDNVDEYDGAAAVGFKEAGFYIGYRVESIN